jgi:hypothetical protein
VIATNVIATNVIATNVIATNVIATNGTGLPDPIHATDQVKNKNEKKQKAGGRP